VLRPGAPDEGDLAAALRRAADGAAAHVPPGAPGPAVRVAVTGPACALPPEVAFELQRVAEAALANAVRHAGARVIDVALEFGRARPTGSGSW
jgi:signal transduction histidine kinase